MNTLYPYTMILLYMHFLVDINKYYIFISSGLVSEWVKIIMGYVIYVMELVIVCLTVHRFVHLSIHPENQYKIR